jgi:hypothetical protein
MFKFNGGRGATICDFCRTMLTSGTRQIRPFLTVKMAEGSEEHLALIHLCDAQCLSKKIAVVEKQTAEGWGDDRDFGAENLQLLIAAQGPKPESP